MVVTSTVVKIFWRERRWNTLSKIVAMFSYTLDRCLKHSVHDSVWLRCPVSSGTFHCLQYFFILCDDDRTLSCRWIDEIVEIRQVCLR